MRMDNMSDITHNPSTRPRNQTRKPYHARDIHIEDAKGTQTLITAEKQKSVGVFWGQKQKRAIDRKLKERASCLRLRRQRWRKGMGGKVTENGTRPFPIWAYMHVCRKRELHDRNGLIGAFLLQVSDIGNLERKGRQVRGLSIQGHRLQMGTPHPDH
jgi:hypothetical protein